MDTSQIEQFIEFPIDFQGQALAEKFLVGIVSVGTFISLLFAFALQNITLFLYPFAVFALIAAVVTFPSYPQYKTSPVTFLKRPAPKQINIELD